MKPEREHERWQLPAAIATASATIVLVLMVHALALVFPDPPPTGVRTLAIVLLCASFGFAGDAGFRFDSMLRARHRGLSWLARTVFLAGLAALTLGGAGPTKPIFAPGSIVPPANLIFLVFAFPAAVAVLLAILLELADAFTRGARRLRTRLVWLALFSAAAALGFYFFFTFIIRGGPGNPTALAWILQLTLTGWVLTGIAQVLAQPMASRLEQLSSAVHEVSRGNLDVKIPDEGRDELAGLAHALKLMVADLRRYVTPAVLFALRRHQESQVSSERREVTVLFYDVRGFTALSEQMAPEEVILMLDHLFERMIEIVEARDGYINRFTGDGMMVVFGAPRDRPDHARVAVDCAIAMQTKMRELNAAAVFGADRRLEIGVGVNTGTVVAGAVGNADREEYTMIGDCVNVASRLCSSAGGGEILIGAATAAASGRTAEALPPLTVKGKSAPLEVFRVAA
jgi:class 3 adenylate cyclase